MRHLIFGALLSMPLVSSTTMTAVSACELPTRSSVNAVNPSAPTVAAASAMPAPNASADDFDNRFGKKVGEKTLQQVEKFAMQAGNVIGAGIGFTLAGPIGGIVGGLIGGILAESLASFLGEELFSPPTLSPWRP